MYPTQETLAFFKTRATRSIPHRPGAIQCVRNCTSCIVRNDGEHIQEDGDLTGICSYDNLVTRKGLWLSRYQSIQYHVGQIDILKKSINRCQIPIIYIVAVTKHSDLDYLKMVIEHNKLEPYSHLVNNHRLVCNIIDTLKAKNIIAIPIQYRSCPVDSWSKDSSEGHCFGAKILREMLVPIIDLVSKNSDINIKIVPVAISKDHECPITYRLGSVCVQILEPFSLKSYTDKLKIEDKSTHLVQHLYHDLAHSIVVLPSHLIAFLILYLEREVGPTLEDLTKYVDWFRRISIDTGMQIGFTGESGDAVRLALIILKDSISTKYLDATFVYIAKDLDRLTDYANLITPMVAYYGLVGRAILTEYNKDDNNQLLTSFSTGLRIRVMRDNVLETSQVLADSIEQWIPCRRPCATIETSVGEIFSQMEQFGKYFKIEEPKVRPVRHKAHAWANDFDSDDEEYFQKNRNNAAFKSWLLLTDRDYRRDRLNLFINAILPYF